MLRPPKVNAPIQVVTAIDKPQLFQEATSAVINSAALAETDPNMALNLWFPYSLLYEARVARIMAPIAQPVLLNIGLSGGISAVLS